MIARVRALCRAARAAVRRASASLAPPPADDEPISVTWSEPAQPAPIDSTPVTAPAIPARMPPRKPRA